MSDKVKKFDYPATQTGGVKPMNIRGIFEDERVRLSEEFTDIDRKWRHQWLKDQILSPNEPRPPSQELTKLIRNPIRRFLSWPFQVMETGVSKIVGTEVASHVRYCVPKLLVGVMATYYLWYHLKYNQNDWTRATGVVVTFPKPRRFPGDPGFPAERQRFEPKDYYDRGFQSRKIFLD